MIASSCAIALPITTKLARSMAEQKLNVLEKDMLTAFHQTVLPQKGVEIIDAAKSETLKTLDDARDKEAPKILQKFPFLKAIFSKKDALKSSVASGTNAFFLPSTNKIAINTKGSVNWAFFHEMGHALNKNCSILGKSLQKCRALPAVVIPIILATALFKRKKVEGEKPQGTFDKITTFIKNNCGKLAFLGFAPILLEEGMASIKGQKLASKVLSGENLKTLKNLHGKAWLTYATVDTTVSLGIALGSKVRDFIAKPKELGSTK